MQEHLSIIKSNFSPLLGKVLKCTCEDLSSPTVSISKYKISISFEISGDVNGSFFVSFSDSTAASKKFLAVTIGEDVDVPDAEACQEIANQLIGRLLGCVNDAGMQVHVSYPGECFSGTNLPPKIIQNATHLSSTVNEDFGEVAIFSLLDNKVVEPLADVIDQEKDLDTEKVKVLIVDDSSVMCAFLQKILIEHGYEVVGVAADGVEAVEMFEKLDPDLVTLDIIMPRMKGTEVLEHILKVKADAKVVMASSISDAKTVMQCLKIGAKRYIIKPYDKEAVLGAVEKALGLNSGKKD